jgi:hypothetical protein
MQALSRFVNGIEGAVRLFGWIAAWSCVALVLVVAGDVFIRYFLRTGAVWLQELHWHLISPIALFGMSYALYCGEQVRVDVLFERFPAWLCRVIEVTGGVLLVDLRGLCGLAFAALGAAVLPARRGVAQSRRIALSLGAQGTDPAGVHAAGAAGAGACAAPRLRPAQPRQPAPEPRTLKAGH